VKTLKDFNFKNKRVLVRCDFDVSLSERGEILEDFRIKKALPTINYLIKEKAKLILIGHLDRPGGRVVEELRMNPVLDKLVEYLNLPVIKTEDCTGKEVEEVVKNTKTGKIVLLENLRFHKGEEENLYQ
jgi:phosphoglycerate kinase